MTIRRLLGALVIWGTLVLPARAYIDVSPTLGRLIQDATHIVVLRVEKVNLEKRAILFQKVADLKGQTAADPPRHLITTGLHPREPATVLEWAEPGQIAISFQNGKIAEICIGKYWYECHAGADGWWMMTCGQAQLSFAYSGSATRLRDHVQAILAGQEVLITAIKYSADDAYWRAAKRVVAMRDVPQGNRFPLCRYKASLKMPALIYELWRDPKFRAEPGAAGREDVPNLITALGDKDWLVRQDAAQTLGSIGRDARPAVTVLRESLQDAKELVRIRAAEALSTIDPTLKEPVPVLLGLLKSPEAKVRKAAAEALGNAEIDPARSVAGLAAAVKDADAGVRWAAVDALSRFGVDAAAATPALVEAVDDSELTVRGAAIDALGSIGPRAKAALPALRNLLKDARNPLRNQAAASLVRIDHRHAQDAIPVFVEELRGTDTRVRWHALHYLRKLVDDAKATVPIPLLLAAMVDRDFGVRGMAAWILGEIGPPAQDAVPMLESALQVNDVWVRSTAATALVKIVGAKATVAIPVLIEELTDENEETREECMRALQRIGPAAWDAIPTLQRLAIREPLQRGVIAETMWRIGAQPGVPVKLLREQLVDPDSRREAIRLLGQMGPAAQSATSELAVLARDQDVDTRDAAVEALRTIDPAAWAQVLQRHRIGSGWRLAAWAFLLVLVAAPIVYWRTASRAP